MRTPKSSKSKLKNPEKRSSNSNAGDGDLELKLPSEKEFKSPSSKKKSSKHSSKVSGGEDGKTTLKTPKTPKSSVSKKKKSVVGMDAPSSAPAGSGLKSPGKHKSKRRTSSKKKDDDDNNGEKPSWWKLENMPFLDNDDNDSGENKEHGLSVEEMRRRNEEVRKLRDKHVQELQNSVQTGLVSRLLEQAKQKEREAKPTILNNVRAKPLDIDVQTYEPPSYKRNNEQKTILKDAAKKNFILKDFVNTGAKTDIRKLVKAFESVEVKKDEQIITEGEQGDHFYVVESGEVEIQVDDKTVATAGAGSTFGERNLLYKAPWNVSVRATGSQPIKVLRLNHQAYRGIMQTTEEAKKPPPPPPKYVSKKKEDEYAWIQNSKDIKEMNAIKAALKEQTADDLERIKVLGEGQFGEVWLVSTRLPGVAVPQGKTKHEFALKIQNITEDEEPMIRGEVKVMQDLSHPFVSSLYRTYEDEDTIDMLLGLIPGGELWDVIHKENEETGEWLSGIPETHAQFYSMVVADTLSYMHTQQFVFRDLKPENIMLDAKGYPIVVDFGFAKQITNKTYTFCGTPNYISPEIVKNTGHNAAADWWAFGIVLYEMVSGENPFYYDGLDQMELFQCICEDDPEPLKELFSKSIVDLINKLLIKDIDKRLGSGTKKGKEILTHPFFSTLSLQRLRLKQVRAPFIPGEDKEVCNKQYSLTIEKERYAAENQVDPAEEAEEERRQLEERKKKENEVQLRREAEIRQLEEEERQKKIQEEKLRHRKEMEEAQRRRLAEEQQLKEQAAERERLRLEEEECKRLRLEELQRQKEKEEERERRLVEKAKEEADRRQREEKEKLRLERVRVAKAEAERRRKDEEERLRLEEEENKEQAEKERLQQEEDERLEAERLQREEDAKKEKARRKEEYRKRKEQQEQDELERQETEKLEKQREAERVRVLQQHQEESEAAAAAPVTAASALKATDQQEEADLSLDDVFRSQSSPTSLSPGKLDKSWSGFTSPSGTKRGAPDVGSVPDGMVSKLLNEHGKYEKSPSNPFHARHKEELNKSIGKGLVAQRLAKAKAASDNNSSVPSMFSYF